MPNPNAAFDREMRNTYEQAKSECDYVANQFMEMVGRYGAIATAKRLLIPKTPQKGFTTLYLCDRLDLTVEFAVLKKEYASVFTDEERAIARQRLLDHRFDFSKYADVLLI